MDKDIKNIKQKTIKGFLWRFSERTVTQLVSFIVSIVLARLLEPKEFGIVALTMVFVNVSNVFIASGFSTALIQKKDSDTLDFSSIFYTSLIFSFFLYFILYIFAPEIGKLYKNEEVIAPLRVLGLILPIYALNSIQQAYLSKQLDFKKFFYTNLTASALSGLIGITLAYMGMGIWAIIVQILSLNVISGILLLFLVPWHPSFSFSYSRFKDLFSYGSKLMFANFLGAFCGELKSFIIGAKYSPSDLAFYNRGDTIPTLVAGNVNGTVDSVIFPAISIIQNDTEMVKRIVRKNMIVSSLVIFPLMMILFGCAKNIILFLFTEKWLPATIFLQISAVTCCFSVLGTINVQALKAIGHSDVILKLEYIKKPLFLAALVISMSYGAVGIAIGNMIYGMVAVVINTLPNKKYIAYSIKEQLNDIFPQMILSVIICGMSYLISFIFDNVFLSLLLQLIGGVTLYVLLSFVFLKSQTYYLIGIIKGLKR